MIGSIFFYVIICIIIAQSAYLTNCATCLDTVIWPTLRRRSRRAPRSGFSVVGVGHVGRVTRLSLLWGSDQSGGVHAGQTRAPPLWVTWFRGGTLQDSCDEAAPTLPPGPLARVAEPGRARGAPARPGLRLRARGPHPVQPVLARASSGPGAAGAGRGAGHLSCLMPDRCRRSQRRRCRSNWCGRTGRAACPRARRYARRSSRAAPATDWPAAIHS